MSMRLTDPIATDSHIEGILTNGHPLTKRLG